MLLARFEPGGLRRVVGHHRAGLPERQHAPYAENVAKAFGSFRAVAGADLTVAEGEMIGLIGPNGAGKSTFFNCLAGDTTPTAGTILFDGRT